MPADILVVTPSTSLGETIRQSLEDTKLYRAHVVNNKASAVVRADEVGVPIAMLDTALGEEWVREIGSALRTIRPGINLVICFDEDESPPPYDELRPWIMVRKPFRLAEFMNALTAPQPAPTPPQTAPLRWLNDPAKAAQHLTRLTLESSAQAALITLRSELWAYAGGLSQNAAKEVAQAVTRNWDGQKGSDLLRFIRLESTKAEHMLYATRLSAEAVLAFVFDAETPFSTIRAQAGQLVNNFGVEKREQPEETPDEEEMDIPSISNILSDIPSPNPASSAQPQPFDPNLTRVSEPLSNASVFSRESSPVQRLTPLVETEQAKRSQRSAPTTLEDVEVTAPSRKKQRPETPVAKPAPGETDVTRESPSTEAAKKLVVEPTTASLYNLTYACLLVPRFSAHYITGDLSERLSEWVPNICIAFGWRLEYLAVRPEYLQWVVNVQPNASPGYLMRIMRQQTSEKIFTEFPRLKKENPSGDFWAPGYLIMGGSQPHPPQLVRDYIRQTRQRQGQEIAQSPPARR